MNKPTTIDEYIADFPPDLQMILGQVRSTIQKAAPKAEEKISYGMPTFYLQGNLVHFAAYKNHIGFYPSPSGLKAFPEAIAKYKNSKGAVQFPIDKPMPLALISKIVKYRVKEALGKPKTKKSAGGSYTKHHNDGSIWAKGKMAGDTPDGYWEWFRKDGTIMRSGYFNNGKQIGEWTTYDKNGHVYKVTQMKK